MPDLSSLPLSRVWQLASALALLWLAYRFGRTLRSDRMPLIEQIARVSQPDLSPSLCRYTRGLTIVWVCYFVVALFILLADWFSHPLQSFSIGLFSFVLFAGEHVLRPRLFPTEVFPGIGQQIRDTALIWRQRI